MVTTSKRIAKIELSVIVQISEQAARMRAEGHDILALSTGEPDFPTPHHICQAATAAMQSGQTKYPPTAGTPQLRSAIARQKNREASEVIVSTGAKQVLANIFLATLNEGDEVICPTPYWSSYADIVSLSGGRLTEVPCGIETGFKLTPDSLEAAITPNTRWLMLNSPSNPTGAVYSKEEMSALGEVLKRHPDVWIVSDEIYDLITYVPFCSFAEAVPELFDRTIIVNGVSKAHSMTGWRIGWGIGPKDLIKAMTVVQGQTTSGASSISQAAALAAITGDQTHISERKDAFKFRRNQVVSSLNAIPGIQCNVPQGAFYVFPSCQDLIGHETPDGSAIHNDADFCNYVLRETGLAIVPGRAFGMPGYFRLSYAYAKSDLVDGCARLKEAVGRLRAPVQPDNPNTRKTLPPETSAMHA